MKSLKTIEELIQILDEEFENKSLETIQHLASFLEIYQGMDWKKMVQFSSGNYSRNRLKLCEDYELVLICWKSGQGSDVHNHAEQGCLVKMLQGQLTEFRYDLKTRQVKKSHYNKNMITYIHNDIGVHQIKNEGTNDSVSLHLYSPGIYEFNSAETFESYQEIYLNAND